MPKTKIPAEVALGLKLRKISNEMLAYVANYPDCAYGRKAYGVIRDIEDRMPRRKVK